MSTPARLEHMVRYGVPAGVLRATHVDNSLVSYPTLGNGTKAPYLPHGSYNHNIGLPPTQQRANLAQYVTAKFDAQANLAARGRHPPMVGSGHSKRQPLLSEYELARMGAVVDNSSYHHGSTVEEMATVEFDLRGGRLGRQLQ